ncbi:MAG: hypothetical protein ACRDXE_08210 [Acidimicrobiales bacterium]
MLTPFEDRDVTRSSIEIPGAAGGLQEALTVEPVEIHHGDERYLVMKVVCTKVRFDPIKDSDALARVQILKPVEGMSTFIGAEYVEKMVLEQKEKIDRLREEASGIMRLPEGPDPTAPPEGEFGHQVEPEPDADPASREHAPTRARPATASDEWDDENGEGTGEGTGDGED